MIDSLARVVALSLVVALQGGCTLTHSQRSIVTYAAVGTAVVGVGLYVHGALSTCPPDPDGSGMCEEDRHDRRDRGGIVALTGLVAMIFSQLLPVSDEPSEAPLVAARVVAPPPAASANATTLRDPAAVKLAENARSFAAAGKCLEAFGSLKALRTIDPALADQLMAWDPTVSRCRTATGTAATSPTALEVVPAPARPPSATPPTSSPTGD